MKRSVLVLASVIVVAPLFASSAPAWAARSVRARFSYTVPQHDPFRGPSAAAFLAGHPFRVQPLATDGAGQERRVVGTREQDRSRSEIYTKDDIPVFVAAALGDTLAGWGAAVVDTAPDLVLGVGVEDFFVHEGDDVSAKLALRLRVATSDGIELWTGSVAGSGYAGPRGSKSDRYDEAVGNALADITSRLIEDPGPAWAVGQARRGPAAKKAAPRPAAASRGASAAAATTGSGVFGSGVPVITQSAAGGDARIVLDGRSAVVHAPAPAKAAPAPAAAAAAAPAKATFAAELVRLAQSGADHDLLLAFARQRNYEDEITADDVLSLRDAGVPDDVIRAALARPRP